MNSKAEANSSLDIDKPVKSNSSPDIDHGACRSLLVDMWSLKLRVISIQDTNSFLVDKADIQNWVHNPEYFLNWIVEGQWSSNQESTIRLSSSYHGGSSEVGEGLGKCHIVRNKRVKFTKLLFFGDILILGHFSPNLYLKREQTRHFSESSGCRLLIAVYVISVGHLQLEKLRFKKRLLHLKSGKFVFFSFLHRVLRVRAVLPIEYPLSNCTDTCLEAS